MKFLYIKTLEDSYANKGLLIFVGGIGILASVVIALCPLWSKAEWDSSITWAGTFCSIIGIGIAIFQIYGVMKSTEAVNRAVADTKKDIEKAFSISNLSKYFEVINTIAEDLQQREYRQALRSMKSLQDAIIEFNEIQLTEIQDLRPKIQQAILKIGSDIEYIQIQVQQNRGFNSENALRNLNRIQKLLSEIKAKLKHR